MSNSSLPQAFRIVRQLLAERPRAFQEILRDGLPTTSTSTSTSASSQTSSTSNGKSSSKGKGKLVAGASHVPADHPFVSANYLKTRILPILTSQGLISKSKSGSIHQYTLTPSANLLIPEHWDRLLSGQESPSSIGHEARLAKTELVGSRNAIRAEADGTAEAERRMMWYRSGKEMGRLEVPLDRGYLNRRRGKKRYGSNKDREGLMGVLVDGSEPWTGEQSV